MRHAPHPAPVRTVPKRPVKEQAGGEVDAEPVAAQVRSILSGGKAGSVRVSGLNAPNEQIPNAKKIQAAQAVQASGFPGAYAK